MPAHPVAGTEHSGPEAGFAELFRDRWTILTPPDGTDPKAIATVRAFWTALGANVEIMEAAHHDMVLAITSHVPHLIAYNIVGTAAHLEEVTRSEVMKFAAGGFRDFTRIAASDPTMWRDVFLNNKEAVLEMLGRFTEDLTALQRSIRFGDGDALFDLFTRTRAIRRAIIEAGQETAATDFGRPHKVERELDRQARQVEFHDADLGAVAVDRHADLAAGLAVELRRLAEGEEPAGDGVADLLEPLRQGRNEPGKRLGAGDAERPACRRPCRPAPARCRPPP